MLYPFFTSGYSASGFDSESSIEGFGIVLLMSVPNPFVTSPRNTDVNGPRKSMSVAVVDAIAISSS